MGPITNLANIFASRHLLFPTMQELKGHYNRAGHISLDNAGNDVPFQTLVTSVAPQTNDW